MKIAIDGPAGAGKSTIARLLAQKLGIIYIDTGAMYRALAWKALNKGISIEDPAILSELACNTHIHFTYESNQQKIFCDDQDVTSIIRSPEVSAVVSKVASYPSVRKIMVKQQQKMADTVSVVMDGRDIGECVLPDADFKLFVTASIEERARRRKAELEKQGYEVDFTSLKKEIMERDQNDANREVGALKILDDSIVIDTSNMSIDDVLQKILAIVGE